ncbi:MAG: adenosine-specific kinase [Thermoplasmata archaeon]
MDVVIKAVEIKNPEHLNFIFGQCHFIKTVEDMHELVVSTNPAGKFGIAFCEASGPCLIRKSGNDEALIKLACENALNVGAGHTFFVFMKDMYPINILNGIKNLSEVATVFCATANPVKVIVASTGDGNGVLGVIDGFSPKGIEDDEATKQRIEFLRKIGYKAGLQNK